MRHIGAERYSGLDAGTQQNGVHSKERVEPSLVPGAAMAIPLYVAIA